MLVLIDGHNLIGKMPDIRLDDPHDEEKLLRRISLYRARTRRKVLVVFDSGSDYKPGRKQKLAGLSVQYAPHGKSADQIIINRINKAQNPGQLLVVTSDRAIQRAAWQRRAKVVSAADFAAELVAPSTKAKPETEAILSEDEVEAWLKLFQEKKDE